MPFRLITHPPSVDEVYILLSPVARRRSDLGSGVIADSNVIVQALGKPELESIAYEARDKQRRVAEAICQSGETFRAANEKEG